MLLRERDGRAREGSLFHTTILLLTLRACTTDRAGACADFRHLNDRERIGAARLTLCDDSEA